MQRDEGLLVDMTQAARQIVLFREQMDFEQFRKASICSTARHEVDLLTASLSQDLDY